MLAGYSSRQLHWQQQRSSGVGQAAALVVQISIPVFCCVVAEAPDTVNPWYAVYKAEFMRLLQFTDHETLDHPVAGGGSADCVKP